MTKMEFDAKLSSIKAMLKGSYSKTDDKGNKMRVYFSDNLCTKVKLKEKGGKTIVSTSLDMSPMVSVLFVFCLFFLFPVAIIILFVYTSKVDKLETGLFQKIKNIEGNDFYDV